MVSPIKGSHISYIPPGIRFASVDIDILVLLLIQIRSDRKKQEVKTDVRRVFAADFIRYNVALVTNRTDAHYNIGHVI